MHTNPAVETRRRATAATIRPGHREAVGDPSGGRTFDFGRAFLPPGLSRVNELPFLGEADARTMSQIQARTYAYLLGLVQRLVGERLVGTGSDRRAIDRTALGVLPPRLAQDTPPQAVSRRMEAMMAEVMPPGYVRTADPGTLARALEEADTWAVLVLALAVELFTQAHAQPSGAPDAGLCPLWQDVFRFHRDEARQLGAAEAVVSIWEGTHPTSEARDAAVRSLIALLKTVDGILQHQAAADAAYFFENAATRYSAQHWEAVRDTVLKAYRWQYIASGALQPRFRETLSALLDPGQADRLRAALAPFMYAAPRVPETDLRMAA